MPHNLVGVDLDSCKPLYRLFSERLQRVKVGNTASDWLAVSKGAPQGSLIGPFVYNIFTNDLLLQLTKERGDCGYNHAEKIKRLRKANLHSLIRSTTFKLLNTSRGIEEMPFLAITMQMVIKRFFSLISQKLKFTKLTIEECITRVGVSMTIYFLHLNDDKSKIAIVEKLALLPVIIALGPTR